MFEKFKEDYENMESDYCADPIPLQYVVLKQSYLHSIDTIIHQMNIPHIIHGKDLYINGYEAHHEKTAKYLQEQRNLIQSYEA